MARGQREANLKFEMLVAAPGDGAETACLSFNHHRDHFGRIWEIETHTGEVAHTACVGFGLERLTIALLRRHGVSPGEWPSSVRDALGRI